MIAALGITAEGVAAGAAVAGAGIEGTKLLDSFCESGSDIDTWMNEFDSSGPVHFKKTGVTLGLTIMAGVCTLGYCTKTDFTSTQDVKFFGLDEDGRGIC